MTDLVESVTTTWSLSLSSSMPWMPEFDRFCVGTSPHNVYPSYSAAMLDEKKVEVVGSREKREVRTGSTRQGTASMENNVLYAVN